MVEATQGEIRVERQGDVAIVRLLGEHDMATAPKLRETLHAHAESGDRVVVSVTEAEYIDSSTLHALFMADDRLQQDGRRLAIHVATASVVRRVLEITGLEDALPCTGSLEEAFALAAREETG